MAERSYDYLFKLLLVGDSGVGKTCILYRYTDDEFNTAFISTVGIDFKVKTIDLAGKKIKLQIWDTAGQERYRTITSGYYRGAVGIMLVYDLANYKSFENINKWLKDINEHASENVDKILIGNKCDDYGTEKRVVTYEQGRDFAAKHGMPFFETSCKTNKNITEAFGFLVGNIFARFQQQQPSNPNEGISVRQNPPSSTKSNCCF